MVIFRVGRNMVIYFMFMILKRLVVIKDLLYNFLEVKFVFIVFLASIYDFWV